MQKKKKTGKIILCILLVILLAVFGVWFAFRKQIAFLYRSYTQISELGKLPSEEIEARRQENDQKTQALTDEIASLDLRDLTEDERAALASGQLSEEEALSLILGENLGENLGEILGENTSASPGGEGIGNGQAASGGETAQSGGAAQGGEDAQGGDNTPDGDDAKKAAVLYSKKRSLLAEVYLLRAEFLNRIDALIDKAIVKYKSLPKEKRGMTAKLDVGQALMADGENLEAECDARMRDLLDRLRTLLTEGGEPTDVVSEIEASYKEQKAQRKLELIDKYVPKSIQEKIFGTDK